MRKKITLYVTEEIKVDRTESVALVPSADERALFYVKSRWHQDMWVVASGLEEALAAFREVNAREQREFYDGDEPDGWDSEWPVPEAERDYTVQEPESVERISSSVAIVSEPPK